MAAQTYKEIEAAMLALGKAITRDAIRNLSRGNINSTSRLSDSIDYNLIVYPQSKGVELNIKMEDYGKFVDQGVRGHGRDNQTKTGAPWKSSVNRGPRGQGSPFQFKVGPPIQVFRDWIADKGIPTDKPETAAYLMRRSAARYGLPRTTFMTRAVKKNTKKFQPILGRAFTNDINRFLKQEILKF